jgi:hypothetical protein
MTAREHTANMYDGFRKIALKIDGAIFTSVFMDDPCTQYKKVERSGWGGRYVFRLNS